MRKSTPELEFETNFIWLSGERTRGWLNSHFDIVDKFSPARRPTERLPHTRKLNVELDTSPSVFNWFRRKERDSEGREGGPACSALVPGCWDRA